MKWVLQEMKPGDLVRIPMGELYHYGVCTGENRVVEFGEPITGNPLPRDQIRVIAVDIPGFLHGEFAEIAEPDRKERRQRRSVEEIVACAENSIGKGGYDLLYNNCEHFAWECVFGRHYSQQVEGVRRTVEEKLPSIHVFIAPVGKYSSSCCLPPFVKKEIKNMSNSQEAAEKAAVWGLLKEAAERAYHIDLNVKKCRLTASGKPMHRDLCFSLAHTPELAAVAVSYRPVGMDLEPAGKAEEQFSVITQLAKEKAVCRLSDSAKQFCPDRMNAAAHETALRRLIWGNKEFYLSVAAGSLLSLHWHQELLPGLVWQK